MVGVYEKRQDWTGAKSVAAEPAVRFPRNALRSELFAARFGLVVNLEELSSNRYGATPYIAGRRQRGYEESRSTRPGAAAQHDDPGRTGGFRPRQELTDLAVERIGAARVAGGTICRRWSIAGCGGEAA
jgi:hypothetical protein